MSISFFIDQENYMLGKFSKSVGAKIVVSDPRIALLPDEHGIDVQPNTATSIPVLAVRKADAKRTRSYFLRPIYLGLQIY